MPRVGQGGIGEVSVVQGGNTAVVSAATVNLDETLANFLHAAAAMYAFNGTDLRRVESRTPADALAALTDVLAALAFPHLWNGATNDRQRNNLVVVVVALAARTTSSNSGSLTNHNGRGLVSSMEVTAASGTTPTLDITGRRVLTGGGSATDAWVAPNESAVRFPQATGATNQHLRVAPGLDNDNVAPNHSFNELPIRTYRWDWAIGGTTPSFTFVIEDQYIV